MKRVLIGLLIIMGIMSVALIIGGLIFGAVYMAGGISTTKDSVLFLEFDSSMFEYLPDDPISQLMSEGKMSVKDIHDVMISAANDPNIAGIVAKFGTPAIGFAQIQEIRDSILEFKKSGKFTIAFADTFGEVASGNGIYYLASSFDEIYLQPSGDIGLTGLLFHTMFYGGAMEKFKLLPRMDHRYEYKSAKNIYTDKEYTQPVRENMISLMDSLYDQIAQGIADGRKLQPEDVKKLIDSGPYLGQECLKANLVDDLIYWDEVKEKIKNRTGGSSNFIAFHEYLKNIDKPYGKGDRVALIIASGPVVRGESGFNLLSGSFTTGSETICSAIRSAVDDGTRAIILRVNSPGGSYVASDSIWREVSKARELGIPVVISMSDLAASGGYFIAVPADIIVAHPGSLTGSIGVLGGKIITHDAWQFLGFSFDEVHAGANAKMYSNIYDYSPEEWERFQAWLDRVYGDFTQKVSDGRKMSIESVGKLAKGRIWTGCEAEGNGLVDSLGGYAKAIAAAKRLVDLPAEADINLVIYPKEKSPLEKFMNRKPHIETTLMNAYFQIREQIEPVVAILQKTGLLENEGNLHLGQYPKLD